MGCVSSRETEPRTVTPNMCCTQLTPRITHRGHYDWILKNWSQVLGELTSDPFVILGESYQVTVTAEKKNFRVEKLNPLPLLPKSRHERVIRFSLVHVMDSNVGLDWSPGAKSLSISSPTISSVIPTISPVVPSTVSSVMPSTVLSTPPLTTSPTASLTSKRQEWEEVIYTGHIEPLSSYAGCYVGKWKLAELRLLNDVLHLRLHIEESLFVRQDDHRFSATLASPTVVTSPSSTHTFA